MDALLNLINAIKPNLNEVIDVVAYLVLIASIIVKMTKTLKDDHYFKPIIKFIGKYIALDKYGPPKPPTP